jgi:signal transduction histidine kinase
MSSVPLSTVVKNGDAERLRRIQLVTDAALSHLDLNDLLAELLTRIRDVLGADTAAVLLRDELRNELVARAAVGLEEEVEQGVRIPIGGGFAGRIAAERHPIVLDDVDHAHVLNPILREKGIKSLAGVPLIFANDVLGVLHVGTLTPREFTKDDVEFLEIVGDRVALAIEHARLFEAERRGRTRLEQVQSVLETTLASLGFEELVGELLVRLRDVLQVDTAAVLMLDESTNELVARAAVGLEEEVEQGVRIPVGGGFAGRVAAEGRPVVLDDLDHAHVLNPILREKGLKSMLGVPLIASDSVIGVLHVGTLERRLFDSEDQKLLQLVASRAAIAIEGARVHDELVRLDEVKLNFVAIASHELRTPATAVFGIASTLRHRGHEITPAAREELEQALWEQAVRFRSLIEQLLDLSRLDAKAILIEPQPVALYELLAEIAADSAPGSGVRVEVPEELEVHADRDALERVFGNLITNAVKYGEPPVVITAQTRDTFFRVRVEDTGQGVPPDVVPRLFERFERGSAGQGSGLGLSIARAYARAHGGELIYDSPPTGGARFDLILPRKR